MTEILKFLFEQATDPLTLPINPIAEWIVLLIINKIVFRMAFSLVGDLYDGGMIGGSFLGKLAHWFIRAIFFVAVWGVVYVSIEVGRFVINNWFAVLLVILLLAIACIGYIMVKRCKVVSKAYRND